MAAFFSRAIPLMVLLALGGCESAAVRWLDPAPVATSQPSPLAGAAAVPFDSSLADSTALATFLLEQDLLREAGARTLVQSHLDSMTEAKESVESHAMLPAVDVGKAPTSSLGSGTAPADSARCARSLRIAAAPGRGDVAVWWSRRDRSRVMLLAAWRDGGGGAGWRGPIVVDSLDQGPGDAQAADRGSVGCARPAASVTVGEKDGYVHVAYALRGPEGAGVFYAHQMDPRSAFEPPVAIVYGAGLGAVRVASAGDVVAVAYEDPNSKARPRIALAISRTSGHLFEDRLVASTQSADARDPHVAVRGRAVVVGWSEMAGGAEPAFRIRRAAVQ